MRHHVAPWLPLLALVAACGASEEAAEAPADPEPRARRSFSEPEGAERAAATDEDPATDEVESPEAVAIRTAEAFIRDQGYTDAPATVSGDAIVREGIEGALEDRHGMLSPRAVSASGQGAIWMVTFQYARPEWAGRGRVLRLVEGSPPQFIHQDIVLSPGD